MWRIAMANGFEIMGLKGVVPVINIEKVEYAVPLAQALISIQYGSIVAVVCTAVCEDILHPVQGYVRFELPQQAIIYLFR